MDALGTAGVPVYAERGAGGGWSLADGYRARLPGLSDAEIRALVFATPARLLADLGLRGAAEMALLKLLAALPALARRDVEDARGRIHVDPAGWYETEENVAALPALQEAIWRERQLCLAYRRGDGVLVERLVDPLGLVAKGRVWYLVAAVEGEPRTYRVSRVQDAQPTGQPSARPTNFDLAAYWAHSAATFKGGLPRYPTTLRVAPALLPRLRRDRIEEVTPPDATGWVTVTMRFDVLEEACTYVLGLDTTVAEVVGPPELRAQVLARSAGIMAHYSPRPAAPTSTLPELATPGIPSATAGSQ